MSDSDDWEDRQVDADDARREDGQVADQDEERREETPGVLIVRVRDDLDFGMSSVCSFAHAQG